jgi:hypothetical protein
LEQIGGRVIFSWFPSQKQKEPTKPGPFPVDVLVAPKRIAHGIGSEISAVGLTFALGLLLPGKQHDLEVTLRNRKIPIRVVVERTGPAGNAITHRCKYIGIAADDWDHIVRFIHDLPDVEHLGSYFDPNIPDDDYRLLPYAVQREIIEVLTERRRINAPPPGIAPLMTMKKVSESKAKDGVTTRKIQIRSRFIDDQDKQTDQDTFFLISSNGKVAAV